MNGIPARRRAKALARLVVAAAVAVGAAWPRAALAYEVWVTDQSDTAKESGGVLYVYDGARLGADPAAARPTATIDFAGETGAYCREKTGRAVRRPHMLTFTRDQRFAIVSFLSGHVLFLDAASRRPLDCLSAGQNAHAAWPTADQTRAVAANITEKRFIQIRTDYERRSFSFDPHAHVIHLGAMETAAMPDNAPICPITDASGQYVFTTLRGGGLLVTDASGEKPRVVATLPHTAIRPSGCGGVQVGHTMYINSGGGWPNTPLAYEVYALDMRQLPGKVASTPVLSRAGEFADAHGMTLVGRHLWSGDRAGNRIDVIDTTTNRHVHTFSLVGQASDDPAPDIIEASPDGAYVFMALRGPKPLTGNHPEKMNARGSTPGVGVVKVTDGGRSGVIVGIARLGNVRDGQETADPHGLAVRK